VTNDSCLLCSSQRTSAADDNLTKVSFIHQWVPTLRQKLVHINVIPRTTVPLVRVLQVTWSRTSPFIFCFWNSNFIQPVIRTYPKPDKSNPYSHHLLYIHFNIILPIYAWVPQVASSLETTIILYEFPIFHFMLPAPPLNVLEFIFLLIPGRVQITNILVEPKFK
jgi:hypothetical protein